MDKLTGRKKYNTYDLILIALFSVLIVICSWIAVPTAVPFTLQTFAVFLAFNVLGAKKGIAAVCVYLFLGVAGIPVFAGFTSGLGRILGLTGGYMIGWIFSGLVIGVFEKLFGRKLWVQVVSLLTGLLVCYVAGTVWFMEVYARNTGPVGAGTALLWCVVPFIIPDLVKIGLALWVSRRLEGIKKVV